jgi:hypothetical protein
MGFVGEFLKNAFPWLPFVCAAVRLMIILFFSDGLRASLDFFLHVVIIFLIII